MAAKLMQIPFAAPPNTIGNFTSMSRWRSVQEIILIIKAINFGNWPTIIIAILHTC